MYVTTAWYFIFYFIFKCKVLKFYETCKSNQQSWTFRSPAEIKYIGRQKPGADLLSHFLVIDFLLAFSYILRRYLSWRLRSTGKLDKYTVWKLYSMSKPRIEFISLTTTSQYGWMTGEHQKMWQWSAITLLHSILPRYRYFLLGVIKNLIIFFHASSPHCPELVLEEFISHMFIQSSSVKVIFASLSQLHLTHDIEMFF